MVTTVAISCATQAQTLPATVVKGDGYTVETLAYIDPLRLPGSKNNTASRYDFQIRTAPGSPYSWDFLLPGYSFPETSIIGAYGSSDYRTHKTTTVHATLRQFDSYEEKVTFKNLDLVPAELPLSGKPAFPNGPRFLSLPEVRSITTPSGIKVTLPAQVGLRVEDLNAVFNGNIDALWLRVQVEPGTRFSELTGSPLYRKHGRPVSLKLEVPEPNHLVTYAADNTFTGIKVSLPT